MGGANVRLVFSLGREEVCEEAGDDDEDEPDDQTRAVVGRPFVSIF